MEIWRAWQVSKRKRQHGMADCTMHTACRVSTTGYTLLVSIVVPDSMFLDVDRGCRHRSYIIRISCPRVTKQSAA